MMQRLAQQVKQMLVITRKELRGYFGSPLALIFIGAFLALTLFFFFSADAFFARGIADVRPLFRWMPLLMIFLVAALTMRQWSEEQRSGTLEILLTLPVSPLQLVLGKFLAVLSLVAVSLALTISLPITVSLLGDLDWGPVVGGYLAALLLAAAYTAIGLSVSSRTDNQIVSLIATMLLCGLFYLLGSSGVTGLVGSSLGEVLRAIGVGSRFESIQRGVIDLRDLVYYLSLTGIFLVLNVLSLISKRWSRSVCARPRRIGVALVSALTAANLALVNVWMYPLRGLRVDLTEYGEYRLSRTTRDLLESLNEPLLLRAYLSEENHPLLIPLIPAVRDMLEEYEAVSGGMVQAEVVDPTTDPDVEAEANEVYGITPQPLLAEGRYETSVVNSYFHILVRYGDQTVVLGFRDLIEVETRRDGSVDVRLRGLEYDLTSAIKKVVYGFQSVDAILAALTEPAELTLYVTPDAIPEELAQAPDTIEKVAERIAEDSEGKFTFRVVDPTAEDSPVTPHQLYQAYGIRPYARALFSEESYYLHLVLRVGDQAQALYPQTGFTEADVRQAIEAGLKRLFPGFLKVVGLWTPPATPTQDIFGQLQQPLSSWNQLSKFLSQEYEVRTVDLSSGQVPVDVDVLVVVAPQNMTDVERFAIDQYLMRGGSVVTAAGNYMITADSFTGGLAAQPISGGLESLLSSYGITVTREMVLDPQNEPFPIPVTRRVGGIQVQEIQMLDYPFFVDVRSDGMSDESPIVSNLPAVTLNWVSPVLVDEAKNANRQVTVLLRSTDESWAQQSIDIQPNFELFPETGFPEGAKQSYPLAISVQGVFTSAFAGQPAPLTTTTVIQSSPETARLVVFGSAEFLDDFVFQISSMSLSDRYLNSLQLLRGAVAWATEDLDMLAIRSRGAATRVLLPLSDRERAFWEVANYVVALLALVVIGMIWNTFSKTEQPMALTEPDMEDKDEPDSREVE